VTSSSILAQGVIADYLHRGDGSIATANACQRTARSPGGRVFGGDPVVVRLVERHV